MYAELIWGLVYTRENKQLVFYLSNFGWFANNKHFIKIVLNSNVIGD